MNDWNRIRDHYQYFEATILEEAANEWALDPYAWCAAKIQMTPIEEWLWEAIRYADMVAYPQYPVGRWFVDFANPKAKVAIECDGAEWHQDWRKDEQRDAALADLGWTVYRITGAECGRGSRDTDAGLSYAEEFIRRICEKHRLSRFDHIQNLEPATRWPIRPASTSKHFGRRRAGL